MTVAATPALSTTESALLWHTWFDAGEAALAKAETASAVEWLTEALRYACGCGTNDYRHPLTEATLAYAHFRNAEKLETCSKDSCLPKIRRDRFHQLAEDQRKLACQHASCALPGLTAGGQQVLVARGRAAFVLGSLHMAGGNFAQAASEFATAYQALFNIASQTALVEEILKHQIEVANRQADDRALLDAAKRLEPLLAKRPDRAAEMAWLLASKADAYLHYADYQKADDLVARWKRLMARCESAVECSLQCAYALEVFGRARLAMGYYADAECYLKRSAEIQQRLCEPHALIAFRVALARAELLTHRGQFRCAYEQLKLAESLLPRCTETFGAYSAESRVYLFLAKGRWYLAIGQYETAQSNFTCAMNLARQECHCRYYLIVPALVGLARIESERSRPGCALVHVNEALCILDGARALGTAEMAWTLNELAYAYLQDNKIDQAEPACRRALDTLKLSLRAQHPDEVPIRLTRAQSICAQHRSVEALKEVETARDLLSQCCPDDLFSMSRCLRIEGEIHHARRMLDCALELITCADHVWCEQERQIGIVHPEKCLITVAAATVYAGKDRADRAEDVLEKAKFCELACQLKLCHEFVAYELNRRGNLFFAHHLYREAAWLYCHAVKEYELQCGPDSANTKAACANHQRACQRIKEGGLCEDCPCVPWFTECLERKCCPCGPDDATPRICTP
jgi:tetratricopeptide (TPR) repeat protein